MADAPDILMYGKTSEAPACPVCGSARFRAMGRLESRSVLRCRRCGVGYAWPRPSLAELTDLYCLRYFGENPHYAMSQEEYLRQILANHIAKVSWPLKGRRVLDFGCGEGVFLTGLKEFGADVYGIESNDARRNRACTRARVPVWKTLDGVPPGIRFHLVIMNEVIEHLLYPTQTLRDLGSLLDVGGGIYVSTPNFGGLKARLRGLQWENYTDLTHLCYFNWSSLLCAARMAGFHIVRRLRTRVKFPAMGLLRQAANRAVSVLGYDSGLKTYLTFWDARYESGAASDGQPPCGAD